MSELPSIEEAIRMAILAENKKRDRRAELLQLRNASERELQRLAKAGNLDAGRRLKSILVKRRRECEERELAHSNFVPVGQRPVAPLALPFGVSDAGAEELIGEWMRHLGAKDVKVTRHSVDGGIDVASVTHIAQVKNYRGTVGAPDIQQFVGVVHVDGRIGLYFTSGTYSFGAVEFAEKAKLALFYYSAESGTLAGANSLGDRIARGGLS